jgi:hypothetical protein
MRWHPIDLGLELADAVWGSWIERIEAWNRQKFPNVDPWISLRTEETVEALDHFKLKPIVSGLTNKGRRMAFYISDKSKSSTMVRFDLIVQEDRCACTISDGDLVLFALCPELPEPARRAAVTILSSQSGGMGPLADHAALRPPEAS